MRGGMPGCRNLYPLREIRRLIRRESSFPAEAIFDAEREIVFPPYRSVHFAYMRMRGQPDDKLMREKRPALTGASLDSFSISGYTNTFAYGSISPFSVHRGGCMKVEIESLDRIRKNIEVILEEAKVDELREGIYQELKKSAKIKGFRPGKVPRSVIQAYYKDYIEGELKRKMVEETMEKALAETDVKPVSEPRIEFLEDGRPVWIQNGMRNRAGIRASCVRGHRGRGREDQGDRRRRGRAA